MVGLHHIVSFSPIRDEHPIDFWGKKWTNSANEYLYRKYLKVEVLDCQ